MDRETSVEKLLKELSKQLIQERDLSGRIGIEAADISRHLNIHRSNASHYLNRLVKAGKAIKVNGRPVYFLAKEEVEKKLNKKLDVGELVIDDLDELIVLEKEQKKEAAVHINLDDSPFKNLIGHNYSLSKQIEQAKAAIMYPPNGLHTLIVGPTGAGKSLFAHEMYQFAKEAGVIDQEAEFINFNCADYSNNPQLLFSQLFGYIKGAFSGAESDKMGLVEMADGSILFLDEIHRLPPEGQETLFNLMDYGTFRRLGETKRSREVRVRIIGATTESPDSVLLHTFLRRIPLVIYMPSLDERPLAERMIFIANFFATESEKIGVPINVEQDIIQALLLYECPGNIGQLKSDIQLMCALAFVEFSSSGHEEMFITKKHIRDQLGKYTKEIFRHNYLLKKFSNEEGWCRFSWEEPINDYIGPNNKEVYGDLDYQLSKIGEPDAIGKKVDNIMEDKTNNYYDFLKSLSEDERKIQKVFGEVVNTRTMKITEQLLGEITATKKFRISKSLLFPLLAIHISFTIKRIESGISLNAIDLEVIDREAQYYVVAHQITETLSKLINKKIPKNEIDYIAFIIKSIQARKREEFPHVAVVVSSKGNRAKQMLATAQSLLGTDHGMALELDSNWKSEEYKKVITATIEKADEGKGVVFICDHSSIKEYIKDVKTQMGIKVELISQVSTAIVVEAIRLSLEPNTNLNDVAKNLMKMTPEGCSLDFRH